MPSCNADLAAVADLLACFLPACLPACFLPAGEQDLLGLAKYPFVPTFTANFSPLLTQLLTQQASWQMLQLAPQLQQLLQS
jgi:hypothetical protein